MAKNGKLQMKIKNILFPLFVIFLLFGCTKAQDVNSNFNTPVLPLTLTIPVLKTLGSSPRPIKTIEIASSTPEFITLSETPIPLTIDPTYLIFPTNTSTPTLDPDLFLLHIIAPGPMSKVISPIDLIIHIAPDFTGLTRIELVGEDGSTLFTKVFKTYSNIGYYTRVEQKVDYEIHGAAEIARLQISTFDSMGLMQAYNSVRLLLLAVGDNQITQINDTRDRVMLRFPSGNDSIKNGLLEVQGDFEPVNDLPVIFELIGEDGNILGSRIVQFTPAKGIYLQFNTSIPYTVQNKTRARLIIRQTDDRIDGLAYLFSRSIILEP